jgi:galactonate dehydratase
VENGRAQVPDRPGLGYDLDREALAQFRVEKPASRPDPPRLVETVWASGRKMYMANNGRLNFMLDAARQEKMPYFERGVSTRLLPDDGSSGWRQLYENARLGPYFID